MRRLLFTLVFSTIMLSVSCQETTLTRDYVLTVLDSLEHKLDWMEYRLGQEEWKQQTTGASDSLEYYQGLYDYVINTPDLLRTLQAGRRLLHDDEAVRRCDLMRSTVALGQVESSSMVRSLRDSLLRFEGYTNSQTPYEMGQLCCNERDRIARERIYRDRNSVDNRQAEELGQLFRMRNQEARRLGYNSCLALSFAQYGLDGKKYLKILDKLNSLSSDAYNTIIEKLQNQIGSAPVEVWDLSFAYNDVERQVDAYFPADSQLSFIDKSLEKLGFDLDNLPIYIDRIRTTGEYAEINYLPIKPPYDVRLTINPVDGLNSTRELLYSLGRALHQTHVLQDRALYVNVMTEAWTESLGETIAALCQDQSWLATYPGLPQSLIKEYRSAHNEQQIIRLRMLLVDLMFEYEAYTNSNRDLNKLYWDLFERYMMLPRHDDLKPWATVTNFVRRPVGMHNLLFGEMIAAQIVIKIKRQYSILADNPEVGSYLYQNYYRFGARYSWRDLLERGTGEKLNPEYLIRGLGI